ncbi:glycine-rich domain-containing protein [Colwellia psychrerythraea]|uniref:Uncharacterized protein n=1 Tax=Colwellia psychrerythraea TaxID=28229 RepID=A0A099KUL2_COLPS|nr:hypothetical protein [Colwellia psychrerythraea]KGJ93885.1 hypothetical protein GAB14E_2440 [Colwellia psychrerythraea]
MDINILIVFGVVSWLVFFFYNRHKKRKAFIGDFEFPVSIKKGINTTYPHLNNEELELVIDTLRSFFLISYKAKLKPVAMPSQVVDVAWHQFILFTKNYEMFCKKGIGRFLHHTPTEAMKSKTTAQEGIKRAWRLACHLEHINPKSPSRLPMLFDIDTKLNIEDGFYYSKNCKDRSSPNYGKNYCASHIGCSSGCGGSSGDSTSSCGGSCGSSCGGGD